MKENILARFGDLFQTKNDLMKGLRATSKIELNCLEKI